MQHLKPCPASPNCVSSDAADAARNVEAFTLRENADQSWQLVITVVADLPRTTIISADERYLHAEARSRWFGFVDDLELEYRPESRTVAVRSASRKGYWDFGVNRSRVETLRSELRAQGAIL